MDQGRVVAGGKMTQGLVLARPIKNSNVGSISLHSLPVSVTAF